MKRAKLTGAPWCAADAEAKYSCFIKKKKNSTWNTLKSSENNYAFRHCLIVHPHCLLFTWKMWPHGLKFLLCAVHHELLHHGGHCPVKGEADVPKRFGLLQECQFDSTMSCLFLFFVDIGYLWDVSRMTALLPRPYRSSCKHFSHFLLLNHSQQQHHILKCSFP